MWDELRTRLTVSGTRNMCLLLLLLLLLASRFHPAGLGDPPWGTLGSPSSSCKLPKPAPAHSAMLGGWHRTRREREAGPRQRQQMGTIWAGGSGRAGSCWSGRAWQPLPRPALAPRPPAPQVSQAARGGGEAWLGFRAGPAASLSGPWFLQAPSQMQGRWRRAGLAGSWPPHHPHREATRQASPPPLKVPGGLPALLLRLWAMPAPGPLHWLCPHACRTHANPSVAPSLPSGLIPRATSLGPPSLLTLLGLGRPPPHSSPHPAPALFSCRCSYSLNCELSVSGPPTQLHPTHCTHLAGSPLRPKAELTSPPHHGPPPAGP